ncbi:MAG: hypothetical protein HC818_04910 [Synechococcaceae cyanobacterium RM1_1_27]|nr:hypothetical protein [Synechococcaceae cyanobacterium RM1_1_27]
MLYLENLKVNTLGRSVKLPYAIAVKSAGAQIQGRFSLTSIIQSNGDGFTISSGGENTRFERGSLPGVLMGVWSQTVGRSLVNKELTGYGDISFSSQNGSIQGHTHYFHWLHLNNRTISDPPHWFIDGTIQGDTIEVMVGYRKGSLFGFLNRHALPVKSYRGNFSITQNCLNLGKDSKLFCRDTHVSGELIGSDQKWNSRLI